MGMARHQVRGETPEEVFVVISRGNHRLYSKLSAARGVRTRESKWNPDMKIMRAVVTEWEEVD
jgi:hypothetical protein